MPERRQSPRERVVLGGGISAGRHVSKMDITIRNISSGGASIDLPTSMNLPEKIDLAIARKNNSFLGRIVWWHNSRAGIAFEAPLESPKSKSEIEQRLSRAEHQNRVLRMRLKQFSGT